MHSHKALKQYLSLYAEKESQAVTFVDKKYRYVIAIPVCSEDVDCLQTIFSLIGEDNILVIVVVNSAKQNPNHQKANRIYINNIEKSSVSNLELSSTMKLYAFSMQNDVLLVDRNSPGLQIPEKQGVGLARKIACDIALRLINEKVIESSWIFSTDADVVLPSNYFKSVENVSANYAAIVCDFEHVGGESLALAQYLYDFKLRYYLAGIQYIGGRYNYIPMGSTLIINGLCYAKVRGFPKRNAGEDFYILNKLAKIKPIKYKVKNTVIKITSRLSQRVPFGTGPALNKIVLLENMMDYRYYHPRCFLLVKKWLDYLKSLYTDDDFVNNPPQDVLLLPLYHYFKCEAVFEKCQNQIRSSQQWQIFVHQWFDAFKTLKAIHFFDKNLKQLDYLQLLKSVDFVKVSHSDLTTFMQSYDKI